MKTLVRSSYVQVIGNIWQPGIGTCAYQYDLRVCTPSMLRFLETGERGYRRYCADARQPNPGDAEMKGFRGERIRLYDDVEKIVAAIYCDIEALTWLESHLPVTDEASKRISLGIGNILARNPE